MLNMARESQKELKERIASQMGAKVSEAFAKTYTGQSKKPRSRYRDGRTRFSSYGYPHGTKYDTLSHYSKAENVLKDKHYDFKGNKFYVAGLAHDLMAGKYPGESFARYKELRRIDLALMGAKLYEKLGKGYTPSVKNRLLNALNATPNLTDKDRTKVQTFIKRSEKQSGISGLLKKILPVICIASFLVGIFFLAPNFTGNAIGSIDKSGSTLIGAGFVVLGILGYYFISKLLGSYL